MTTIPLHGSPDSVITQVAQEVNPSLASEVADEEASQATATIAWTGDRQVQRTEGQPDKAGEPNMLGSGAASPAATLIKSEPTEAAPMPSADLEGYGLQDAPPGSIPQLPRTRLYLALTLGRMLSPCLLTSRCWHSRSTRWKVGVKFILRRVSRRVALLIGLGASSTCTAAPPTTASTSSAGRLREGPKSHDDWVRLFCNRVHEMLEHSMALDNKFKEIVDTYYLSLRVIRARCNHRPARV